MRDCANIHWTIEKSAAGSYSFDQARLAVLMDIRAELQKLNGLLHCHNFVAFPHTLLAIQRNTAKQKRKGGKNA